MIEVENILFDFNGTLVDDVDLCLELLNAMLKKCQHRVLKKEEYFEVFGFPVIDYYKKAGFIFPQDNFDELAVYFIKEYTLRNKECPLYDDVEEVLNYFKEKGKTLNIVSASEINVLKDQLKLNNIYSYFDGISGLDNINAKSKLDTARSFMAQKKYNPQKTILIGDTMHDAEVASSLGVKCILVARGHQSLSRLQKCGVETVTCLKDLIKIIQ